MTRLLLLLGLALRSRLRGFASAGASSVFLVLGGLFYLGFTCAMGVGAFFVLSRSHSSHPEGVADMASLVVTMFGVFFLTRPLILNSLAGSSLQNLLHLPIKRRELLMYSLVTGVVTPLVMESPVLIGAALGAASHPVLLLVTLPLALLTHLILLAGAHAMSLFAVLVARRTWISDLARVLAFSIFFLPSLLTMRGSREFLRPLIEPLALLSPLGWGARATIHAGAGDFTMGLWFAIPAALVFMGVAITSMALLNRILSGEGEDHAEKAAETIRPVRVLLPGALGALIETQLRTQLRTPAARIALLMPTFMMGLFALTLLRPGQPSGGAFALVAFLSLMAGSPFAMIGRGISLILGAPVSRAFLLVASDASGLLFRLPPLLAIIAIMGWQAGATAAWQLAALAMTLVPISMGVQHFVSILRPFALPRDRFNPYAQRVDSRQTSNGLLSLLATVAAAAIAAPLLFLWWLSSRIGGNYGPWMLVLSCLGALAMYAVLIALAERLFLKRELRVLEVLLDDSPG